MKNYTVEITDLFGGELNYSYLTRLNVTAKSMLGAIQKVSRETGLKFRLEYGDGWENIYHSTSKLTGVVIEEMEEILEQ
jgi:hypothetical protein